MSDLHAAPLEDEPQTPMWLPALGAALFVGAGLWWAITPAAVPFVPAPTPSASAPVAPSPPAVPVASAEPPPPPPPPVRSAMPPADGRPPPGAASGSPAAAERMRRLRQQLQLKGAGGKP